MSELWSPPSLGGDAVIAFLVLVFVATCTRGFYLAFWRDNVRAGRWLTTAALVAGVLLLTATIR